MVDGSGKLVGLITFRDITKKQNFPNACKDHLGRLRVGAAVSVSADVHERIPALINADVDVITVDTAHGHSAGVLNSIKNIRKQYPDLLIIGGNVATKD